MKSELHAGHGELTWQTISKDESELTPEESKLVNAHLARVKDRCKRLDEANKRLRKTCKIVTSGAEKTLIPSFGWIYPVEEMAYAVESLNILYKKHRVYATFDQVKEKYADFRGYFSISVRDSLSYKILMWPLLALQRLLAKVPYKLEATEKVPTHDEENWIEHDLNGSKVCLNPLDIIEVGEKKLEKCYFRINAVWSYQPSKYKLVYRLHQLLKKLAAWQSAKLSFLNDLSAEDEVIKQRFDSQVEELVNKCEKKCRNYCIECGNWIDDSNRYSTTGWYTYVCKSCAKMTRGGLESCINMAEEKRCKEQAKFEEQLAEAVGKVSREPFETLEQFVMAFKFLSAGAKDDEADAEA